MKKLSFFLMAMLVSLTSFAAALGEGYSKVTDITTLSAGDKVVLYCDDADKGVTGWDGNKTATAAAEGWVEYVVEAADGGVLLKDGDKYVDLTAKNSFHYTATGGVCKVTADGILYITLAADSKDYLLYENANNGSPVYRMYVDKTGNAQYKPVYVYEVVVAEEGGETPEPEPEPTPDPEEPETPVVPEGVITCAEAVAICEQTGSTATSEQYTIRGYVTNIVSAYNAGYNNISFWMADTKDGGNVFQAYRSTPTTDTDKAVKVGDYVEVTGQLTLYGTTPEAKQGGTYTILEAAEGEPETPVLPEFPEGPITCAQALEVCLATGTTSTTDTYTIQGYVTEIKDAYSTQYQNISFWMADTKDGGNVLLAYRVKGDATVKVGDKVEVIGTLVNYSGNTPEVNSGGTYTILEVAEGGETPEPTPDPEPEPETPVETPLTDGYTKVTNISALTNGDKVVLYCDLYAVGVAGHDGNKTGIMAADGWVEYVVETVDGGIMLKDEEAGQYAALLDKNSFHYAAGGSVFNVTENAILSTVFNEKIYFLYRNANTKYGNPLCRMYVDKSGDAEYAPFYVYEVIDESGSTTPEPEVATWTVAGAPIFDAHWDPTAEKNDMTLQDNGTYTWEKTEIELAAYTQIEFKVVKDHAWTEAYPGSNYAFSVAEDGIYTITITFDPTSKEVAAVATKTGDAEINVEISYVLMGVQGDWTTGIALTQNPENPNEYMLIDQEILAGDAVKVVTLTNGEKSAYCGNVDEYSVAHESDGDGNIVLAPGLYDFYFKVADNVIYIGGEAYPQVVTHTIEGEVLEKNDGRYLTLVAEDETHGYIELNIFGYDGLSESYSISGAIDGVNVEGTCTYTVDEEAGTETLVASVVTDDATVKYEITLVYTIPAAQQYLIMMTEGIEAVSQVEEWEDIDEEGNPVTIRIASYSWYGSNEEWEVYIEAGETIEGAYIYGSAANLTTGQVAELSVVEDSYAIEENYGILSIWGVFTDGLNTYELYLEGQLPVVEEEGTTKYITVENADIAPGMDIATDLEIWAEDEDYNTIMIALTEGTTKMYGDYTAEELYISYNWETATLLEETVGTYKLDGEVAVFEATVLCGADTLVLSISGTPWVNPATIVPIETVEMKFYEGTVGYRMGTTNIAGTNAEATLNIGIIGADESNMYDQEWSADDLSWNTTLTIADKEVTFIYGTVTIKKDGDDKVVTASLLGDDHVLYVITLTTGKKIATALENLTTTVAPVKAIVNGQLVIVKDGVQYNAQGAVVK